MQHLELYKWSLVDMISRGPSQMIILGIFHSNSSYVAAVYISIKMPGDLKVVCSRYFDLTVFTKFHCRCNK